MKGINYPRNIIPIGDTLPTDFLIATEHNKRAEYIVRRISDKIDGYANCSYQNVPLSTEKLTKLLIHEAASPLNLAPMFNGWCIFW